MKALEEAAGRALAGCVMEFARPLKGCLPPSHGGVRIGLVAEHQTGLGAQSCCGSLPGEGCQDRHVAMVKCLAVSGELLSDRHHSISKSFVVLSKDKGFPFLVAKKGTRGCLHV